MKKILIFLIATLLVSCNSGQSSENVNSDSSIAISEVPYDSSNQSSEIVNTNSSIAISEITSSINSSTGEISSEEISSHSHTYGEKMLFDENYHWQEVTCGHDEAIKKERHTFESTITKPTGTACGYTKHNCKKCDYYYTDNETDPLTYTVTWKNYDGSILETDSNVPYGFTPSYDGDTPTKPSDSQYSYTFSGWSPDVTNVTGNKTYTAQFTSTKNTYTVTWKNYDGSILETDSNVPYGSTPTYDGATPSRPGDSQYSYTWSGWTPSVEPVTTNITYVATFSNMLVNAKISFDLNGGTTTHSTESFYSSTIESKDFFFDVKKENYNFRGWSYNGQMVLDHKGNKLSNPSIEESMVFKAEFAQNVILTIYSNMPNAGTFLGEGTYEYNTNVNVSAYPNQGYSFVGWYYNNTLLSNQEIYMYMIWSEDVSLEARFEINSYNLHVESAHPLLGQVMIKGNNYYEDKSDRSIKYLESVSISAYTKTEEYRFLGWYDASGKLVTTNAVYTFVMANYDYSLYARWEAPSYCLTVTSNDDSLGSVTGGGTYEYGSSVSLTATTYKSTFEGWYEDGKLISTDQTYTFTMPAKNYNLIAKFEPIAYTINYVLDNGINNSNNPSTYNCTQEVLLYEPTREHYTFDGWLLNGKKITSIAKGTNGNITLVATWVPNSYNVNITSNDDSLGSVTGGGSYQHGSFVSLTATTYNGIFEGWYEDGKLISTDQNYTFTMPTNNITLEAKWNNALTIENQTILSCNKDSRLIIIPAEITNIGNYAFENCSSLTSITIPNSVTSIGSSAFSDCSSLENVYYKGTIEDWCKIKFSNFASNPMDDAKHFYMLNANNEYEEVTSIVIPDTITSIGVYQFFGFNNVTTITIPNSVTSIGDDAFSDCSSLTSITIPNSVTSIGYRAFKDCSSLTSITIPNSVTKIGYAAFSGCRSLTSITIPNSVTEIDGFAFSGCRSLTSVTFENVSELTSIGHYAFSGCSSLTSIEVPNSVISIEMYAFSGCSSLTSITIPNSVTKIDGFAFSGCNSLTIYCEASSAPSGWHSDWWNYSNRPVYWAGEWSYVNGVPTPNN